MSQDALLQFREAPSGLDAEFLGQVTAGAGVGLQCLALTTFGVQGDHEELPGALAVRVGRGERLEPAHDIGPRPKCQLQCQLALDQSQPQALPPDYLGLDELPVLQVTKDVPGVQAKRVGDGPDRPLDVTVTFLRVCLSCQVREAVDVALAGLDLEPVAASRSGNAGPPRRLRSREV